jgi:hypothetical protein
MVLALAWKIYVHDEGWKKSTIFIKKKHSHILLYIVVGKIGAVCWFSSRCNSIAKFYPIQTVWLMTAIP